MIVLRQDYYVKRNNVKRSIEMMEVYRERKKGIAKTNAFN